MELRKLSTISRFAYSLMKNSFLVTFVPFTLDAILSHYTGKPPVFEASPTFSIITGSGYVGFQSIDELENYLKK